ncbi:MAG: molybdopterin-guanine dinucleotide biosynthesis protein MobB [Thermodesulfobacteriota bacterium]
MRVRSKFWLEDESGEALFGEGRCRILELIDELGTMQATAKALNMSYRGVWARLKATEERLGFKLVETSVGRGKDKGSRLTPAGRKLLADYQQLTATGQAYTDELFAGIILGRPARSRAVTPAVAVVGPPGSGKSTLIAEMIALFAGRGRRAGVIERLKTEPAPENNFDRFFQAGAPCVIMAGPAWLAIHLPPRTSLTPETVAANYALGCDLILVRSEERVHLPTVELFRRDLAKMPLTRKSKDILALIGDRPEGKENWPHFRRDDVSGLIDLIEAQIMKSAEQPPAVELFVNGRRVPLLPFVQDIVANSITGLVSSLKSCQEAREIKVTIHSPEPGRSGMEE